MTFSEQFLSEVVEVVRQTHPETLEHAVDCLAHVRDRGGRLFVLGVGGSAANASHVVNDFRKLCCFEAYSPADNVSELTARTNDEGWDTVFAEWLKGSRLNDKDGVLVLSVGGGNLDRCVQISFTRCSMRGDAARRLSGSSDVTEVTPPRSPTFAWWCRP
jgi:D-sedoheptulose 7-phosphate isomerase